MGHANRPVGWVNSKRAKCHPDRPHEAKGLCGSCYALERHKYKYRNDPAAGRRYKVKLQQKCLLKKAGWTPEGVEQAKRKQKNICAICKTKMLNPQADHEHVTPPNPRELLCRPCNMALGLFKDSPKILRSAAQYVEKHKK